MITNRDGHDKVSGGGWMGEWMREDGNTCHVTAKDVVLGITRDRRGQQGEQCRLVVPSYATAATAATAVARGNSYRQREKKGKKETRNVDK